MNKSSQSEKTQVSVYPSISRDSAGNVKRKRMIVVVDIVPNGKDYHVEVASQSLSAGLIGTSHPLLP